MDSRPHPFASKLSPVQAEEVRRLRARGLPLAELAEKFGISKSSACRIIRLKAHAPAGTLRLALPDFERALIEELAEDEAVPAEKRAADMLIEALRSRAW